MDINDHDLQDTLDHFSMASTRRIDTRRNGKLVPTAAVILNFRTAKIYTHRNFSMVREKKVMEYHPKVNGCFKCQRFGHSALMCNSRTRCPTCGGSPGWNKCQNKENPYCTNCSSRHSAAYLGCPKYKDAPKIQEIKNKLRQLSLVTQMLQKDF